MGQDGLVEHDVDADALEGRGGQLGAEAGAHDDRQVFTQALDLACQFDASHLRHGIIRDQGVEVGLASKLAGHANPNVTLSHYTQAVRGGEEAMGKLEEAFNRAG